MSCFLGLNDNKVHIVECYTTKKVIKFLTKHLLNIDVIRIPSGMNIDHPVTWRSYHYS